MAQAYRSTKSNSKALSANGLVIAGCYNHDQKVVVEWESILSDEQIREIVDELPDGNLTFKSIRASFSASHWDRYEDFNEGLITNFKLSRRSTRNLIEAGIESALLRPVYTSLDPDDGIWAKQ